MLTKPPPLTLYSPHKTNFLQTMYLLRFFSFWTVCTPSGSVQSCTSKLPSWVPMLHCRSWLSQTWCTCDCSYIRLVHFCSICQCNVHAYILCIGEIHVYIFPTLLFVHSLLRKVCYSAGVMEACLVAEVADGSSNVREVWKLSFKQA